MATKKIFWKDGMDSFYKGVPAEKVVEELNKISTETITPEQIIDVAKDKNNLLHQFFEWNDTVAADKYRKIQAQQMLCKITYVTDDEDNNPKRYYYNVSYSTGEYHTAKFVFEHEDTYLVLKERAIEYLRGAEKRFRNISELQEVWDAIDKVLES